MSGASDVRKGRKSVNSARVRCSGHPEKVGRPVLRGGPDVRKSSVVRWVGVNAKFQIREVIFGGGLWGIWEGFRGGNGGGRLDPLATQQIH